MVLKVADDKGRISLGKSYANATMLAEQGDDGTVILRPAVTVPAAEAWIWQNKAGLAVLKAGLHEARRGEHAKSPDMRAAAALAAKIKD